MAVRVNVVEALVAVFDAGDAESAPLDATSAEREQAAQLLDSFLAREPIEPVQLTRKALMQAWRPGDDWDDMFDRLSPDHLAELRATFAYLPARVARLFAKRFIMRTR